MRRIVFYSLPTLCLPVLFILGGATLAHAQLVSDPMSFRVTPEAPAPGERVLITLIPFPPLDPAVATITWSLNGTPIESGVNKTVFAFTMGPAGQETRVGVSVSAPGIIPLSRTLTFNPGAVELVWEAQTYTPPFYGGRGAYSPGARVTVMAVPSVRGASVDSLVFSWEREGEPVQEASGRGKNVFSFAGSQYRDGETVAVSVTRSDGSLAARKEVFLPMRDPRIVFYERDPLRGVRYERALQGAAQLSGQEASIIAEPFFFSALDRSSSSLRYSWVLNGSPIDPQNGIPGLITLRHESQDEGQAVLELEIQNLDPARILQGTQAVLGLLFGSSRNTFFGITI